MKEFKDYLKFKKKLNKEQKSDLSTKIYCLRTAMICEMIREMDRLYTDYLDANGHPEFYEIAMEICDEVLFTDNSDFLIHMKLFYKEGVKALDVFHEKHDNCVDWHFMYQARTKLTQQMSGWETK